MALVSKRICVTSKSVVAIIGFFPMRFSFALLALSIVGAASAAAVNVSYTVSGTSGAYVLDFSVNNNIAAGQNLYFFGVKLGNRNIVGSPTGYDPNRWPWWENSSFGGSSTRYDNVWIDTSFSHLGYGSTQSGFQVAVSDLTAPTSVQWFAVGYGPSSPYGGSDYFYSPLNPGFEGVASQAVPEPMSMAALSLGAIAMLKRRRKSA